MRLTGYGDATWLALDSRQQETVEHRPPNSMAFARTWWSLEEQKRCIQPVCYNFALNFRH